MFLTSLACCEELRLQATSPLVEQVLRCRLLQLLAVGKHAVALVVGEFHRVHVGDVDRVCCQLVNVVGEVVVLTLLDLRWLLAAVDGHARRLASVRDVNGLVVHECGIVNTLRHEGIVGIEILDDGIDPNFSV